MNGVLTNVDLSDRTAEGTKVEEERCINKKQEKNICIKKTMCKTKRCRGCLDKWLRGKPDYHNGASSCLDTYLNAKPSQL
jgi:hypothetical protein